ncbi:MAG: hypothetical protein K0U98_06250 [Deltaproteobacteria bacterium]|nr:hypothetical protein [Deltaproteobacteria bacterium]
MSSAELPAFDQARKRLQSFLGELGRPQELVWVFREDFYSPSLGSVYCASPLPIENPTTARSYYDSARDRDLGICLVAQFEFEGRSAISAWAPNSNLDAQYARVEGLKLSVASTWTLAHSVTSSWAWRLHRWRSTYRLQQRQGFDVPLRSALQAWIELTEERKTMTAERLGRH